MKSCVTWWYIITANQKTWTKKCNDWYHNKITSYIVSNIIECDVSEIYTSHTYIYMILDKDCPQYVARNLRAINFIYSLDEIRCVIDQNSSSYFFLIKIHPTQGWTATATHIEDKGRNIRCIKHVGNIRKTWLERTLR